jgi:hypothetical protein
MSESLRKIIKRKLKRNTRTLSATVKTADKVLHGNESPEDKAYSLSDLLYDVNSCENWFQHDYKWAFSEAIKLRNYSTYQNKINSAREKLQRYQSMIQTQ